MMDAPPTAPPRNTAPPPAYQGPSKPAVIEAAPVINKPKVVYSAPPVKRKRVEEEKPKGGKSKKKVTVFCLIFVE